MVKMSQDTKRRVSTLVGVSKRIFHVAFIPTILYLGFRKGSELGAPPLTVLNLLWQ